MGTFNDGSKDHSGCGLRGRVKWQLAVLLGKM